MVDPDLGALEIYVDGWLGCRRPECGCNQARAYRALVEALESLRRRLEAAEGAARNTDES